MKLTCLSKGRGFHFPPCYILNVCGFQILLDCPLDLSALTAFSPLHTDSSVLLDEDSGETLGQNSQKREKPLAANNLVHSEPYYKTVTNLLLLDSTFIDVVLISSPMGMLGLPFLTRTEGFSAKIYATEAAIKLGQLTMEDLVTMHMEFRQFYGPEESTSPRWMKWEELEVLPSALKEIFLGIDGSDIGSWVPLYSAADVRDCMQRIEGLKYAEETCYNGALILKPFSSGLEIGTCNWTIRSPKGNIGCISSSIFESSHAMNFDYHALEGLDLILYSDLSLLDVIEDSDVNMEPAAEEVSTMSDDTNGLNLINELLLDDTDNLNEMEKLASISSCVINAVKSGGSVLVSIGRLGVVFQLLEKISESLESSNLKVPIFMISSVAEETIAFSNIIPEWLCKQRQEKLYLGESLFVHADLIKLKKLHLSSEIHSEKLLRAWQEPCIVFCPHWSLRLGPVVHLLRRWSEDHNSLLIMENGVDARLALLPFEPAMKVLQCSFLSGMSSQKIKPLTEILHPKYLLFPENLKRHFDFPTSSSTSLIQYSEGETLCLPQLKLSTEIEMDADLVSQMSWESLKHGSLDVARLMGELSVEDGKHRLYPRKDSNCSSSSSQSKLLLHCGSFDLQNLMMVFKEMGIHASVEQRSDSKSEYVVHVVLEPPKKGLVEVKGTNIVISAADEASTSVISLAVVKSFRDM